MILWVLRSVGFVLQTLHKPYTKLYTATLHSTSHKTLHSNYAFWFWIRNARNVQKLMRHLMRQLMGLNGETFLAGIFFETLMFMNWFIKKPVIGFGIRNTRNVQKLMRHLMRQLMGINGETFLAGFFWNINVHELIH